MLPLKIERPLAVFDIEATGINPRNDRIVELAVIIIQADGNRTTHSWRINPEKVIPQEVIEIHGITNEDIADCPTFSALSTEISAVFQDCDLCGYNIDRFDIPMLSEEFNRAGIDFDTSNRSIIDVQRIFHKNEPRTLSAALEFYCDEKHVDAHGAEADVVATIKVLEGQFVKYSDLPTDIEKMDDYCNPRNPNWVDKMGRLTWSDNVVVFNFGKHKGIPLKDIINTDPGFIKWMLNKDFPKDTKAIIENAMNDIWPQKEAK